MTGTDYSEAGVELARAISARSNVDNITFLVGASNFFFNFSRVIECEGLNGVSLNRESHGLHKFHHFLFLYEELLRV